MNPFNKIREFNYIRVSTGEIVETINVREFYVWDRQDKKYRLTRHYDLAKESEFNPGFGCHPQYEDAFPKGQSGF